MLQPVFTEHDPAASSSTSTQIYGADERHEVLAGAEKSVNMISLDALTRVCNSIHASIRLVCGVGEATSQPLRATTPARDAKGKMPSFAPVPFLNNGTRASDLGATSGPGSFDTTTSSDSHSGCAAVDSRLSVAIPHVISSVFPVTGDNGNGGADWRKVLLGFGEVVQAALTEAVKLSSTPENELIGDPVTTMTSRTLPEAIQKFAQHWGDLGAAPRSSRSDHHPLSAYNAFQSNAFGGLTPRGSGPEVDDTDALGPNDESDVSHWIKDTFTSDGVAPVKRLGKGKSETTMTRTVTRLSNVHASSSLEAGTPTSAAPPPSITVGQENDRAERKTVGFGAPKDESRGEKREKRTSTSVAFTQDVDSPDVAHAAAVDKGGDNRVGGDSSFSDASGSDAPDPFSNVQPLKAPSTQETDATTGSPTTQPIPTRKSSQYFRRQSAILLTGSMTLAKDISGDLSVASPGGQTLTASDVLAMRLSALGVPVLDVDDPDFDIFDACHRIDSGELALARDVRGRQSSSSGTSSSSKNAQQSGSSAAVEPSSVVASQSAANVGDRPPLQGSHIFSYVCVNVFLRYSFVDALKVDLKKLFAFLGEVERVYQDNPYHNAMHAADVLQTAHIYLMCNNVYENFFDREILCMLLAALVHDVGHLGVNNQFLIKTHHPLAILYNGLSPLENMHSLIAFRLLGNDRLNFLCDNADWTSEDYQDLADKVVEIVIATDMKFHGASVALASELLREGFTVGDTDVDKLIKIIIHAADLSNPMKPRAVYQQWFERVMAEFFSQGAAEAERGLPISPNFDRNFCKIPEMQVGFINFVVKPYVRALSSILPEVWLQRLNENLEFVQSLCGKPYERQDAVLALCAKPWEDRWSLVSRFMEPTQLATSTLSNVALTSASSSLSSPPATSEQLPPPPPLQKADQRPPLPGSPKVLQATLHLHDDGSPLPALPRPASSSAFVSPAAAAVGEAQTRFCLAAYEATQVAVDKLSAVENTRENKLLVAECERYFAFNIVRQLVKAYDHLSNSLTLFANVGPSARSLITLSRNQIVALLTTSPAPAQASGAENAEEVRAVATNRDRCLALFQQNWKSLSRERPFSRYTPRGKEQDVYKETVRQCTHTFVSVLDHLRTDARRSGDVPGLVLPERRTLLSSPDPFTAAHGRALYSSNFGGDSVASTSTATSRAVTATGYYTTQPIGGMGNPRGAGNDNGDTPFVSGRTSAPPAISGDSPTTTTAASGIASSPHRRTLPPLSSKPNSVTVHLACDSDSPGKDADDDLQDDAEPAPAPLDELERQAQVHFQQPHDHWRLHEDGSPKRFGLSSVGIGSFRRAAKVSSPSSTSNAAGGGGGGGGGSRTTFLTNLEHFDVPEGRTQVPALRVPSHVSLPPHSVEDATPLEPSDQIVSLTAGIPNAYFLPTPGATNASPLLPPSSSSQQFGAFGANRQTLPGLDHLSFIPMVHSVDPSPRRMFGSPPGGALDFPVVTGLHGATPAMHSIGGADQDSNASPSRATTGLSRGGSYRAMMAVEDRDLGEFAASSTTSIPPSAAGAALNNSTSSPSPEGHRSPKRRSNRQQRVAVADPEVSPADGDDPMNNPLYRQQLAAMSVTGMEVHNFSYSAQGSPVPISANTPLPHVTPEQQAGIDDGVPVPEVYRAGSMRSALSSHAGSFRY